MSTLNKDIDSISALKADAGSPWDAINPESAARMRAQNKFKTGLDIAKYTAGIMRRDMAEF
ncbi:MAG: isocitrate lyase, partial [Oceanospirillaceae bacterium]|nr:isocitrate lyase [Oceanospirillaceae bacterium]